LAANNDDDQNHSFCSLISQFLGIEDTICLLLPYFRSNTRQFLNTETKKDHIH
jgi:hypothetical protein